ncbi:MAG: nucleoside recognition family protein [Desulfuromonadales bacterium]|nr:nucleoside recognition family protein [Desulfuromonadales bacterium]
MQEIIQLILASGKSAIDLALYVLLPVMVLMMAFMKLAESKGLLSLIARALSPTLRIFGVPGAGGFAMVQLLLVSFAAPLATLTLMERDNTTKRQIAATLAMIFTMSQANVVFPLVAVGLDLGAIIATSLVGGLAAASLTYYLFTSALASEVSAAPITAVKKTKETKTTAINIMIAGGQEATQIVLNSIPILVLAIFLVGVLKASGTITFLEGILSPVLGQIGLPGIAVLPIVTKFLAGGTAMMGVVLNLLQEGTLSVIELNRMAGFIVNPLDIVGVAVLISAGNRCASVVRPAIAGACAGLCIRGILHLLIF